MGYFLKLYSKFFFSEMSADVLFQFLLIFMGADFVLLFSLLLRLLLVISLNALLFDILQPTFIVYVFAVVDGLRYFMAIVIST